MITRLPLEAFDVVQRTPSAPFVVVDDVSGMTAVGTYPAVSELNAFVLSLEAIPNPEKYSLAEFRSKQSVFGKSDYFDI